MSPRRHRWITMPSGGLLFGCLALPGYRECSVNYAMTSEPLLVAVCVIGLAAAVCALAVARRRFERKVAIGFIVLAVVAAGVLTFACAAVDHVYAGISVGLAAAVALIGGTLVWEREARGRFETAVRYLWVLAPLSVAAIAITAMLSTWEELPSGGEFRIPDLMVH
jgi:ABC-type amino acid transport substrate-binding protein